MKDKQFHRGENETDDLLFRHPNPGEGGEIERLLYAGHPVDPDGLLAVVGEPELDMVVHAHQRRLLRRLVEYAKTKSHFLSRIFIGCVCGFCEILEVHFKISQEICVIVTNIRCG